MVRDLPLSGSDVHDQAARSSPFEGFWGFIPLPRTTRILREYTDNLEFTDPWQRLHVPALLDLNPVLGLAADVGSWSLHHLPRAVRAEVEAPGQALGHLLARKAAREADVVVSTYDELAGFGLEVEGYVGESED